MIYMNVKSIRWKSNNSEIFKIRIAAQIGGRLCIEYERERAFNIPHKHVRPQKLAKIM